MIGSAALLAHAAAAQGIAGCADAGPSFATVEAAGARDGATIRLADGREVRLAGVIAATELDGDAEATQRATAFLNALVAGRRIALRGAAGARDRYGRLVAQVTTGSDPARWVQAALVEAGMARAAPGKGTPDCAKALLFRERAARAARVGLWSERRFAVQEAESIAALLVAAGRYVIVEGTVRRVGEAGGRLFLDFGRRYTEDFTIVIAREAQAAFAAAGVDLRGLSGKRVRARGVLYAWGGPAIEIRTSAALELLDAEGA